MGDARLEKLTKLQGELRQAFMRAGLPSDVSLDLATVAVYQFATSDLILPDVREVYEAELDRAEREDAEE